MVVVMEMVSSHQEVKVAVHPLMKDVCERGLGF